MRARAVLRLDRKARKKYTVCGGTFVIPHGTPQKVPQCEINTRCQVPDKMYGVKALPHRYSKLLSASRAIKSADPMAVGGVLLHLGARL